MEAYLYEKIDKNRVKCNLCNHRCIINHGKRGICGVRENQSGILKTLVYGKLVAINVDPVEKKPLFHVMPGTLCYSIATLGCNLKCTFCQNAEIAHIPTDYNMIYGEKFIPEQIVEAAEKNNCKSIAYTYTEPTVFFEFAYHTAKLASKKRIKNVFVTNGYMTSEALQKISPFLDAANVDLKGFTDSFYKTRCKGKLGHVLNTLKLMKSLGIFIEVTTLLIPGLNDNHNELEELAMFIAQELGVETPWHISRFHPCYKLQDISVTPVETLIEAREIGIKAGLKYVYTGNVPGETSESTFCYNCNKILIERWGYTIKRYEIKNSRCVHCNTLIHGIDL